MYYLNCARLLRFCARYSKRYAHSNSPKNIFMVECLKKRTLLKLSGNDTKNYLQSMMTNDIQHFDTLPSLYSMLLNSKGRVLYDIILYKLCENEYLVEYDSTAVEHLERHLIMYRLRKDVKVRTTTGLTAWVIYKEQAGHFEKFNSKSIIDDIRKINGVVQVVDDPRINDLGVRVVTNKSVDLHNELLSNTDFKEGNSYRLLRYKLGIGEGVLDYPPGECQPMETNVDFLNGVSFSKGCYIGQEMAAKSRHVLVIRRRIMPVILKQMDFYPLFPPECPIVNENSQKLGRLRSHFGQFGLALLKYDDCAKSKLLKVKGFDVTLESVKPQWWPSNIQSDNE